jgi:hypothetical protein
MDKKKSKIRALENAADYETFENRDKEPARSLDSVLKNLFKKDFLKSVKTFEATQKNCV